MCNAEQFRTSASPRSFKISLCTLVLKIFQLFDELLELLSLSFHQTTAGYPSDSRYSVSLRFVITFISFQQVVGYSIKYFDMKEKTVKDFFFIGREKS